MKYYIVDAFTDQLFGGNPAGVVMLDGNTFPNEAVMLQIAAELRYSETAFVRRHSDNEFTIRYFTPKAEVELCGHATIATFGMLHQETGISGCCLCNTNAGDLNIEIGDRVMMQMAAPRIVATIGNTEEIYRAIGLTDYKPSLPVQIAYSGLSDIMIPLPDVATLQTLSPKYGIHRKHHKEIQCGKLSCFCLWQRQVHCIRAGFRSTIRNSRGVGNRNRECRTYLLFAAEWHNHRIRRLLVRTRRGNGTTISGGNTHYRRRHNICWRNSSNCCQRRTEYKLTRKTSMSIATESTF